MSVRTHSPTPILKYGRGTLLRFIDTDNIPDDVKERARRTMKRLEAIAMQDYGFDHADELAMKKEDCKK